MGLGLLSDMTSKMGACGSAAVRALLTARSRVLSRACVVLRLRLRVRVRVSVRVRVRVS